MWRVVVRQIATLKEIETHYDIVDLFDANEALDLQDEAERRASERVGKK